MKLAREPDEVPLVALLLLLLLLPPPPNTAALLFSPPPAPAPPIPGSACGTPPMDCDLYCDVEEEAEDEEDDDEDEEDGEAAANADGESAESLRVSLKGATPPGWLRFSTWQAAHFIVPVEK